MVLRSFGKRKTRARPQPGRALRRPLLLRPPSARRPANGPLLWEVPATEPQNLKTAHPGGGPGARTTRPRSSRVPGEEEPPGPTSPPGALLGLAPRPPQRRVCLPRPARPARPGPRLQPPTPHARGAPRASPSPPPNAWNPTGHHPRRGKTASHPQLSAARSPEPDPNARAPYLPAPWALRKTRKQIALPEPRGGERQSPERIRARDLANLWGTRKARATPGAETFSLCVFCGKSEDKEQDSSDHPSARCPLPCYRAGFNLQCAGGVYFSPSGFIILALSGGWDRRIEVSSRTTWATPWHPVSRPQSKPERWGDEEREGKLCRMLGYNSRALRSLIRNWYSSD
jgi:hypothetical protein